MKFEIWYQSRRLSTWFYFVVILFLSSFWILGYVDFTRDLGLELNSLFIVYSMTAFPQLFALLVIPAMAADAGLRDIQSRLYPLYYTTPMERSSYLFGRFCGIWFLQVVMMIAAVPFAIVLSTWISEVESSLFGTFQITSYIYSFLLFTIPNLYVATAIVFSAVLLNRNAITGYLAALFLFLCSVVAMDGLAGMPSYAQLANLMDFSGATILKEIRITSAYKSTTEFADFFLLNKLIWLNFGFGLLAITFLRFKLHYHGINKNKKVLLETSSINSHSLSSKPIEVKIVSRKFDYRARVQQILEIQKSYFLVLIKSPASIGFLIIAILLVFVLPTLLTDPSEGQQLPTTYRLIMLQDNAFIRIVMATLISIFAGQLVWREREEEINELFDSSPITNYVVVVGKFLALVSMLISIQTIFIAIGVIVQVLLGYYDFNFSTYFEIIYGSQLLQLLLFSALAFAVHVFINQKYLGHTIILLLYCYTIFPEKLGIHHDLFVFGSPVWPYPPWFSPKESQLIWMLYKFYWLSWAFLLMIFATFLTIRGKEDGLRVRWQGIGDKLSGKIFLIPIVVIISSAGLILYME